MLQLGSPADGDAKKEGSLLLPASPNHYLTAWDRAFLTALYRTEESPKNLRAELATSVAHDVSVQPL